MIASGGFKTIVCASAGHRPEILADKVHPPIAGLHRVLKKKKRIEDLDSFKSIKTIRIMLFYW